MKNFCFCLPMLLIAAAMPCAAQQIALANIPLLNAPLTNAPLINAPNPSMDAAGNLGEPAPGAIMRVPTRPVVNVRQNFALSDWGLLGGAAALRFLDYKSTVKCMSDPKNFKEEELPNALVHNDAGFAAFEVSTVVANFYAYRFFIRHNHRTMARLGQTINLGAMAWTVGRNYYELNAYWPRLNNLSPHK